MTMTRKFSIRSALVFLILSLAGISACTSKPTGYSDYDIGTDFSGFKSFAFPPGKALVTSSPNAVNPALEPTLKEVVREYLTGQGFTYSEKVADADFVVGFAVGGAPTVRTTAFVGSYRQVYIAGQTMPTRVVTQEGTEGGLVIDIYERESEQKKWMGWAIEEITYSDQVRLKSTVRELVKIILKDFPPSS